MLGKNTKKLFTKLGLRAQSPADLVEGLKKHFERLEKHNLGEEKLSEEDLLNSRSKVTETLGAMKFMLYGDADNEPKAENRNKLTSLLHNTGMLVKLIIKLRTFDFEGKKDGAAVVNHIVRRAAQNDTKDYLIKNMKVIQKALLAGYDDPESALQSGTILQEIAKQEVLTKALLEVEGHENVIFQVMEYGDRRNFDIMSDAFTSLKLLTTRHKALLGKWLQQNYDVFFKKFNSLISSKNYVTRRQSLRLLGEILLERSNFNVMMKYIDDRENLKLMMTMLKDKSKAIQFEAFHVFKVFVVNPKQPYSVKLVLWNNKKRLIQYLGTFQADREDQQFIDEKSLVIKKMNEIEKPVEEIQQPIEEVKKPIEEVGETLNE